MLEHCRLWQSVLRVYAVVIHEPTPPAPKENSERHSRRLGHGRRWRVCCSYPQRRGTRAILWESFTVVIIQLPCFAGRMAMKRRSYVLNLEDTPVTLLA